MNAAPATRPTEARLLHERRDGEAWLLELEVPAELRYFDGHFPQAPVLPGAVQIAWALALAAQRLGTSLTCRSMEALKFQQLLRPGDRVQLSLRTDARGKLHFSYSRGDIMYSSGRLLVGNAHG